MCRRFSKSRLINIVTEIKGVKQRLFVLSSQENLLPYGSDLNSIRSSFSHVIILKSATNFERACIVFIDRHSTVLDRGRNNKVNLSTKEMGWRIITFKLLKMNWVGVIQIVKTVERNRWQNRFQENVGKPEAYKLSNGEVNWYEFLKRWSKNSERKGFEE